MKTVFFIVGGIFFLHTVLVNGNSFAAELNLFDEVRSSSTSTREEARSRRSPRRAARTAPEFVLLGTSNIGGKYRATLETRDGKTIIVAAKPRSSVAIKGHNGYKIVDIKPRKVSISYPEDNECMEFSDKGVTCSEELNIAVLTLAFAPITESSRAATRRAADSEESSEESPNSENASNNPFANALRANANRGGANAEPGTTTTQNNSRTGFRPRRIDPADVPPGKRVISTPFGDRLVDL